jgi:hypothetical protein
MGTKPDEIQALIDVQEDVVSRYLNGNPAWLKEAGERRRKREAEEAKAQAEDDAKAEKATETAWLCASTDPERDRYANEMAGRKLHAVPYVEGETTEDIKLRRSACGRKAKHGWCSDLFNNKCKRCLAKVGEAE